ncbi:hypothetical protein N9746_03885 [Candidatus Thioglobus sp.]|nr:hypothetical protein [Candidatus Thioglobus sp.]
MTISEEQIIELAQKYLSKLQRANEIEFATNKPGVGEDYYDFIDGLDSKCSHLSDDFRIGYQNDEVEADLESALGVANIKVDRESKEYKLLISKFLFAATQACFQSLSMYKGDFDYKLELTKLANEEPLIKKQAKTLATQEEVNKLAKKIMNKYPRTSRYDLANEIADKLVAEDKILKPPKLEAIRKKYLTTYPNF